MAHNGASSASPQELIWRMLLVPETYDRSPLTAQERAALAYRTRHPHPTNDALARQARQVLARLARPLSDVAGLHSADPPTAAGRILPVMYREMQRLDTTFWDWPPAVWQALIGREPQGFARDQHSVVRDEPRAMVRTAAYLFGGVTDLRSVGISGHAFPTARAIFGGALVEHQLQRVMDILGQDGYSVGPSATASLRGTLSLLFLLSRSPYLEQIAMDTVCTLTAGLEGAALVEMRSQAHKVARALWALGLIDAASYARLPYATGNPQPHRQVEGIAPTWVAWAAAWYENARGLCASTRNAHYVHLLAVGRWLARTHPQIVSPEQWDEELAQEYVTYACGARVGDDAAASRRQHMQDWETLGRPVRPTTIDQKLQTLRRVFADWQDRPHRVADLPPRRLPIRFKPVQAFQTPLHVHRLLQPDPRTIDEAVWWKLMRAAAALTEADLSPCRTYPVSFVRAVALLWVTSARRPNEIGRLRVGCIRRDWDPAMRDEEGLPVEQEQDAPFTYVHVPSGKNRGPFWVPIPSYTADAVEAWEQQRPQGQPALLDPKDGVPVDLLFCYRGQRLGVGWINERLIPLLCRVAGVPTHDARGALTAHRGRSTIATLLRKAGVSLDDISTFLGHSSPEMVKHYARTDPFQFARSMRKADDLLRIVEGLLDPHAAAHGQPSVFFYLGYGADKRPRFCGNPAWQACAHRLACQQCQMYIDANQAQELEQRDGVIRFEAKIPMLPEERAVATGDLARMQEIVDAKRTVPTPEPPSAAFVFNPVSHRDEEVGRPEQPPALRLVEVQERLEQLSQQLAAAKAHKDGRNVLIRSLEGQLTTLNAQRARLEHAVAEDHSAKTGSGLRLRQNPSAL